MGAGDGDDAPAEPNPLAQLLNETASAVPLVDSKRGLTDNERFVALTRASGALEIYTLPDMTLRFAARHFSRGPPLARHSQQAALQARATASTGAAAGEFDEPRVTELLVTSLHDERMHDDTALYVMALLHNDDLVVYRAFRCVLDARTDEQLLPVRLTRVEHRYVRRKVGCHLVCAVVHVDSSYWFSFCFSPVSRPSCAR